MNNSGVTKKEKYDALVHQITREDNLVSNRINWFLAFQGFLYAATGAIISSELEPCKIVYAVKAIACFGIIVAAIVVFGVIGAEISIHSLRKHWKNMESDYIDLFPHPYGKGIASFFGALPRFLLPAAVILAWVAIFFYLNEWV